VLPPDSGSLRADLTSFVGAAIEALEHPLVARIGAELVAESATNPALAEAIATRFSDPRRAAMGEMLARAVARGEAPAGADVEIALDLLAGPARDAQLARRRGVRVRLRDSAGRRRP
jgi:hypothetical protein